MLSQRMNTGRIGMRQGARDEGSIGDKVDARYAKGQDGSTIQSRLNRLESLDK